MTRERLDVELGNGLRLRAVALCASPRRQGAAAAAALVLSRFARARFVGETIVVESPASDWRVELTGPAASGALARLGSSVGRESGAADSALVRALAEALWELDIAVPSDASGRPVELPEREGWEHHDLALHRACRLGRDDPGCGARPDPLPDVPPALPEVHGELHPLPIPEAALREMTEGTFLEVLETRACGREHGPRVIALDELAEFLFRTSRVAWTSEENGVGTAGRPYPSGGGGFELDVFCAVAQCDGLRPGLYRYVPDRHALESRSASDDARAVLLADARTAVGAATLPQVLVVIVSRFGRLSRRYQGLAYATTLKNVGVLMQTMCLTATAMGLAACPVGSGNSDAFAAASDTNPLRDPAVGELTLGATD